MAQASPAAPAALPLPLAPPLPPPPPPLQAWESAAGTRRGRPTCRPSGQAAASRRRWCLQAVGSGWCCASGAYPLRSSELAKTLVPCPSVCTARIQSLVPQTAPGLLPMLHSALPCGRGMKKVVRQRPETLRHVTRHQAPAAVALGSCLGKKDSLYRHTPRHTAMMPSVLFRRLSPLQTANGIPVVLPRVALCGLLACMAGFRSACQG